MFFTPFGEALHEPVCGSPLLHNSGSVKVKAGHLHEVSTLNPDKTTASQKKFFFHIASADSQIATSVVTLAKNVRKNLLTKKQAFGIWLNVRLNIAIFRRTQIFKSVYRVEMQRKERVQINSEMIRYHYKD